MTMLYSLSSSKRAHGFASGPVKAVLTGGSGHAAHLNKETGKLCEPHGDSVRECLPHHWRKAWDRRAAASFTYISEIGSDKHHSCYKPLHDARGRHIATIYATPYYVG